MIQDTINLIVNRYRKLGYNVKNIKWRIVESFAYSELAPLSSEKTNDITALKKGILKEKTERVHIFFRKLT